METTEQVVEDVVSLTYNPLLSTTVAHRFFGLDKHTPNQERLTVLEKAPLGHLIAGFVNQLGSDLFEGNMATRDFSGISGEGVIVESVEHAEKVVSVLMRATHHRIFPAADTAQSLFALEYFTPALQPTGKTDRHPDTMDFQGQDLPVFKFTLSNGETFESTLGRASLILQLYYGLIDPIYMGFQNYLGQNSTQTSH